jgi:acyl-CoA reductase-like NAD-dependent aldehyde dehydrogenase
LPTKREPASKSESVAKHLLDEPPEADRIDVRKTYKLYLGGAFPRSESGRVYPVSDTKGQLLAQAAQASRKDVRDAVVAARKAFPGWSGATAYNRGQVLYRVAEMLEGRRAQFEVEIRAAEGLTTKQATQDVDAAIDRWVWYAGWSDKYAQIAGSTNPVAGPYFNFSIPEPTGVVGLFADPAASLLGLVTGLAPIIATGNTVVALASHARPLPAMVLAECLATADLPAGVVNILTGDPLELGPWLAGHRDVNGLDLTGVGASDRPALAIAAADTVTRVFAAEPADPAGADVGDPGIERLLAFLEIKTVWHPVGV